MTKVFLVFILAVLLALTYAQPDVRTAVNGTEYNSVGSNWNCVVSFLRRGEVVRTETLNDDNTDASSSDFDFFSTDDDDIDAVSWRGTSCNCWIVLFEGDGFDGDSIALWTTNTTQGSYDLTAFGYRDDSDLLTNDDYNQWNTEVSSYRIFCF